MHLKHWILLFVLGAIWGGSFLFAKVAVAEIPPFALVFLRVSIAGGLLLAVALCCGMLKREYIRRAPDFLVMGFLNNAVPFSLLFIGQTAIGAGLASILNATTPIFTVIVAGLLVRQEKLSANKVAGVVLGLVGVAVMLSGNLAGIAEEPIWAQLCCLGAAVSYAFAATFAKRFKDLPPTVSAAGQLTGSTLLMLPLAAWSVQGWSVAETSIMAWTNVLMLGTLATAVAYLIYFRLLAEAGATNASLVTLLVPGSAIVSGWLLLGEKLSGGQIAGLAVLLSGLIVLDGRVFRLRSGSKI